MKLQDWKQLYSFKFTCCVVLLWNKKPHGIWEKYVSYTSKIIGMTCMLYHAYIDS